MLQETTLNLQLPLMQAAQAQKHVTHNEALQHMDALLGLRLEAVGQNTPPLTPVAGQVWAIGDTPEGAWSAHAGALALKLTEGWLFVPTKDGMLAWDAADERLLVHHGGLWSALPQEDLAGLGIGTSSDSTNVLAISGPASLFSHNGAGHQLKINKASTGQTASVLLQSNWSGRAEFGLMGQDEVSLKVSPDGSTWKQAFSVDGSAWLTLGQGVALPNGTAEAPSLTFAAEDDLGFFRPTSGEMAFVRGGEALVTLGESLVIDLAVTGSAVVQSHTDASAGRLVTPGWMGLGATSTVSAITDLDDVTLPTGAWVKPAIAVLGTLPPSVSVGQACYLRLERLGHDTLCQTLWPSHLTGAGGTWQRMALAGVWGEWRQIQASGLLGVVAQSSGIPTGSVFETGSTANGDYLRFADGTQICTISGLEVSRISNTQMAVTWTLPKAFVGAAVATLTLPQLETDYIGLTPDTLGACFCQPTTTTITMGHHKAYGAPNFVTGAKVQNGRALAIGRWV